jgi:hypothetical protein
MTGKNSEKWGNVWTLASALDLAIRGAIDLNDLWVYATMNDAEMRDLPTPSPTQLSIRSHGRLSANDTAQSIVRLGYIGLLPVTPEDLSREEMIDKLPPLLRSASLS